MRTTLSWLLAAIALGVPTLPPRPAAAEDPRQFVRQAVETELAKDRDDHSHWLYLEIDQKPEHPVMQWVAETLNGNLRRVLQIDGRPLSPAEQRQRMDAYLADPTVQTRLKRGEQHDDKQAAELLEMLPQAFIWTNQGVKDGSIVLHFKPDPSFRPPDLEARVFAAMEGNMAVDAKQYRIVSLKGRMISDVKFFGGLLGQLDAGGTFDVERRQTGAGIWQITETHVHIQGHALIFKNISEQEDDVKSNFKPLPATVTMQQVKSDLLAATN